MRIRLDKYLADMGYGTRSEIKKEIVKGNIQVNGAVERKPETKIDTEKDKVIYNGIPAVYEQYEYYMLNKPAGVVSATSDRKDRTVVGLIEARQRKDLFPVGRLDKDTEGLLLITNDGELAHRLLSPKKHVDKVYYVKNRRISDRRGCGKAGGWDRHRRRQTGAAGPACHPQERHSLGGGDHHTGGKVSSGKTYVPCAGQRGNLSETSSHGLSCIG